MVFIPFRYMYLYLTLPFSVVWVVLYYLGKSTRKEQLRMSLLGAFIGPLSEVIYFKDYWLPQGIFPIYFGNFPFMIEDVLFGFAIGGIGAVIFEVVFRARLASLQKHSKYIVKSWAILLILLFALYGALSFDINSIYASAFAFIIASFFLLLTRRDLLLNAVGSGLAVMFVMFVCYFVLFHITSNTEELFKQGWLLYGSSLDWRIVGIPVTEMTWGFTWGFLAGPLYEYLNNKKTVSLSRK